MTLLSWARASCSGHRLAARARLARRRLNFGGAARRLGGLARPFVDSSNLLLILFLLAFVWFFIIVLRLFYFQFVIGLHKELRNGGRKPDSRPTADIRARNPGR